MSRTNEGAAWTILGYLLSGPLFWGGVGYGLDAWLGTGYFLASGLLLGMGAALYLVWRSLCHCLDLFCLHKSGMD